MEVDTISHHVYCRIYGT